MTKPATDTELLDATIQRCEHIRDFGNATHIPELAVAVQRLAMMMRASCSTVEQVRQQEEARNQRLEEIFQNGCFSK